MHILQSITQVHACPELFMNLQSLPAGQQWVRSTSIPPMATNAYMVIH